MRSRATTCALDPAPWFLSLRELHAFTLCRDISLQARARRDVDAGPELSADFLDAADDDELEGNLGAIKRG